MKYIIEFEDEPCMYEDEVHFYKCIQAPWWGLSEKVIKQLTPYQPEPDCVSRKTALDAFGLSEKTRKYGGDHSGYDTRMLYEIQDTLESLPAVQPDHVADVSKKVFISCGHENDQISRQALYKYAQNQKDKSVTPNDIMWFPPAQPEQKWIPCSERLPEKPCYCLTSNEYSNVCEDFYWGEDSFEKANKYHYEVLAWMPLPEPYRGGGKE